MIIEETQRQALPIRLLDFIDLNPSTIKNMFCSQNMVYISREKYTDVYEIYKTGNLSQIAIQQVLRLQPCEYILNIDGLVVMILPFELRVYDGKWEVHFFTTQVLSIYYHQNGDLYTFHEKESVCWKIRNDDKTYIKTLPSPQIPYHITNEGILEGYGKKIKSNLKQSKFTVIEQKQSFPYIFVGTDTGHLHIYERKFMTHVKTIRRHEAPILSIKLDSVKGVCYFSGSDSRISSIKLLDDKWILGSQVRGQSHDVYSLELCGDYLISGGITTDLCFYERNESGQLGEWVNKVSYSNEKVGQKVDNYVFVNKISGMQIWRMDVEYENVEMLVKYDLPESKHIKQLKVKRLKEERSMGEQDQYFLFMSTENEGVGWIFSEEKGLTKQYTISKHYDLVQFCPETKLMITLSHMTVQKLNYKTGKVQELCEASIHFPTDIRINEDKKLLISSKYSQQLQVINLKSKKNITKIKLSATYGIIDFYLTNNIYLHYFNTKEITLLNSKGHSTLLSLPITNIRFCGFIEPLHKRKKYWYGVGDTKIVLVSKFQNPKSKKTMRHKEIGRTGTVVGEIRMEGIPYLGVVPLQLSKIQTEKQAVIVKKIE